MSSPNPATYTQFGLSGLKPRQLEETQGWLSRLWGFVLFMASTFIVVCLALLLMSYDRSDPGFSHVSTTDHVTNFLGHQGAWGADLIYLLFGWGAWVALAGGLFLLVRGWRQLRGRPVNNTAWPFGLRLFAFFLLVLASCALFFLRLHSSSEALPATSGGIFGSAIGSELLHWMGPFEATALCLVLAIFCAQVFLGFSWWSLTEKVGALIESPLTILRSRQAEQEDAKAGQDSIRQRDKQRSMTQTPPQAPVSAQKETALVVVDEVAQPSWQKVSEEGMAISPSVFVRVDPGDSVQPPEEPKDLQIVIEEDQPSAHDTISQDAVAEGKPFVLPGFDLLLSPPFNRASISQEELNLTSQRIEHVLAGYKIPVKVLSAMPGPVITRFKVRPGEGVQSRKIVGITRDLARGLGQSSVRVDEKVAEIDCIALEVPNSGSSVQTIYLKEILDNERFRLSPSHLTLGLGKTVSGEPAMIDLAEAPHLLVAGTTGSGKSVGINAMILSMLFKNTPEQLRLILIDPKGVEFGPYEDIPHLLTPVITDMTKSAHALDWAVTEMERRFSLLRKCGVRNFNSFNEKIQACRQAGNPLKNPFWVNEGDPVLLDELPYIVIIIDELADLLMTHGKQVESSIARLAQKARAAGMHLILATQRPSADVVTPLIKSNCPTRLSFQVASHYDSITILNNPGAEELLGRGDMLFSRPGKPLMRMHGAFVADGEIGKITDFLKAQAQPVYVEGITEAPEEEVGADHHNAAPSAEQDALYDQAVQIVLQSGKASISYVQRRLGIGYNRSANLFDAMERAGIVSAASATGKRRILVSDNAALD